MDTIAGEIAFLVLIAAQFAAVITVYGRYAEWQTAPVADAAGPSTQSDAAPCLDVAADRYVRNTSGLTTLIGEPAA